MNKNNKNKYNKIKNIVKRAVIICTILINSFIVGINTYWFFCGYKVYTWIKPVYVRTDYGMKALDNMENLLLFPLFIIIMIFHSVIIIKYKIRSNKLKEIK